jgi:type IV pilus assembly protein PilA
MIYCRGCGKQIHETAPTCPHCGAPQSTASGSGQYTSYDQVPWYRKNWFAILCAFVFIPGLLFALVSGDVYYERKGELRTYNIGAKIFLIIWSTLVIISFVFAFPQTGGEHTSIRLADDTLREYVSEGLSLASGAKLGVTDYYAVNGEWPANNADAGVNDSITGNAVKSVKVGKNGAITIQYNDKVDNQTMTLIPSADDGSIRWNCTKGTVPDKYRPANCRQ